MYLLVDNLYCIIILLALISLISSDWNKIVIRAYVLYSKLMLKNEDYSCTINVIIICLSHLEGEKKE